MKFVFAENMDLVDPDYDFVKDRSSPEREPYWDDMYTHEMLGYAPYDGLLVSKGLRNNSPCLNCNANGTLHGEAHVKAWEKYYKI